MPARDGGEGTQPGGRERSTRQFNAVLDELQHSRDFRSAQDIHASLRASGTGVGLATVYRALQSMVDSGRADALRTASGELKFRGCSQDHHHHLVCRTCSRTVEVRGPAVETWASEMAKVNGYVDVSHTLELFGICAQCRTQK